MAENIIATERKNHAAEIPCNGNTNTETSTNQNRDIEISLNYEQSPRNSNHDAPSTSTSVVIAMSSNPDEIQQAASLIETNAENEKTNEAEKPKKPFQKPKEEVTFRTHMTSLAHVSVLVFVYTVLKLAFRGDFDFFTWHPILMSVGWMLLMTEGLYAINKYNTYWRFKTKGGFRVQVHVAILATGYALALTGFAIVYINKENKGKHHFVSWHALFGLIGLISTFPPILNGIVLWYRKELSNYIDRPRLVKFIHVSSGTVAFFFGALSLVLSVYTNWYARKSNKSASLFYLGLITVSYPLIWAVYGPSVKLARVIREYFSEDKED